MNYYNELSVFQELAKHYVITDRMSLGMSSWWRNICIKYAQLKPGYRVLDLMCGDGRGWPRIKHIIGEKGQLKGLDFCEEMLNQLPENDRSHAICAPFQQSSYGHNSMDAVISTFGMKTLKPEELQELMKEIDRVLKSGGHYALMELKMPKNAFMKFLVKIQLGFFSCIASIFCPTKKASVTRLKDYMTEFAKTNYTIFYSSTTITTQVKVLFGGLLILVYGRKL